MLELYSDVWQLDCIYLSMRYIILATILFSFISCGKVEGFGIERQLVTNVEPAEIEPFSYHIVGDNCTTGEHIFQSFARTCEALKNNDLNQNCAIDQREDLFVFSECDGEFS